MACSVLPSCRSELLAKKLAMYCSNWVNVFGNRIGGNFQTYCGVLVFRANKYKALGNGLEHHLCKKLFGYGRELRRKIFYFEPEYGFGRCIETRHILPFVGSLPLFKIVHLLRSNEHFLLGVRLCSSSCSEIPHNDMRGQATNSLTLL